MNTRILIVIISIGLFHIAYAQTEKKQKLKEVIITTKRNKATEIDKKVYTPKELLGAQNASAKDLIQVLPSVNMGNEGNSITLRNDENVTIMINGKLSSISGETIDQIPASSIETIEVITVPNAKYNSEGSAGIINIVLKKAHKTFNGGYISGSIGNNNKYNTQVGYNYNIGKFTISTGLNYTYEEFENNGVSRRLYLDNIERYKYNHSSQGEDYKRLVNARLGIEYTIDTRNYLSLNSSISKDWGSNYSVDLDTFNDKTITKYNKWKFVNTQADINLLYDVNLNYTHWMKNLKDKWTIDASIADNLNDKREKFDLQYDVFEYLPSDSNLNYKITNKQKRQIYALQTDYKLGLNSSNTFESGARIARRDYRFDNIYFDKIEDGTIVPKWTNDFKYEENVISLYGLLSSTWSHKISTKVGLRLEQTNSLSTDYDTVVLFKNNYFNAFPSFMGKYAIGQNKGSITLSYSMRINRPNPGMLNPLQYVGDPVSKRLGNPQLQPEIINSYEIGYGNNYKNLDFNSSLYFKQTNNSITRFLTPETDGTFIVKAENIGIMKNAGWELMGNMKVNQKLKLTMSSNLSYNSLQYSSSIQNYENTYINWQGRGIINYKLPLGIESQLIAFYRSPFNSPQGTISFMSNVDISLRKKVFSQKGTIVLSMFDIFNDRKFEINASDTDFTSYFYRKKETRYVTLSFKYSFGKENVKNEKRSYDSNSSEDL